MATFDAQALTLDTGTPNDLKSDTSKPSKHGTEHLQKRLRERGGIKTAVENRPCECIFIELRRKLTTQQRHSFSSASPRGWVGYIRMNSPKIWMNPILGHAHPVPRLEMVSSASRWGLWRAGATI